MDSTTPLSTPMTTQVDKFDLLTLFSEMTPAELSAALPTPEDLAEVSEIPPTNFKEKLKRSTFFLMSKRAIRKKSEEKHRAKQRLKELVQIVAQDLLCVRRQIQDLSRVGFWQAIDDLDDGMATLDHLDIMLDKY